MMREPVATTQTRQVRVMANILMKVNFYPSSFDCSGSLLHYIRESAQSVLLNITNHNVISKL